MKTQLNMWVYKEDAAAIRANAAREDMPIGEYVTRTVLGRDPAHPPCLEERIGRIEHLLTALGYAPRIPFDAEDFARFRADPENQARVERILGDESA